MTVVEDQRTLQPLALELAFSSAGPAEEEKQGDKTILWKDILREGDIARTPGRADKVPFKIVAEGRSSSSKRVIAMSDLMKGFDAKAFEDVTIPDGHPKPDRIDPKTKQVIKGDSALNNTGYVEALRIVKKDVNLGDKVLKDCHVLQGGMAFTEPEVAAKVKRGSVPNVSSGIFFDFVRKADDRYFPCALNHVALTKTPWISGLEAFPRAYFGDDVLDTQDGVEFEVLNFLDDSTTAAAATASVIWNENDGANQVRDAISQALNPQRNYDEESDISVPRQPRPFYWVQDITHNTPNLAQVEESYKGKTTKFVVPYSIGEDGSVEVAPATRWVEGKQAMIAASDGDGSSDPLESFVATSFGKLREKLGVALSDLLGDEAKNLSVKEVSTEHKALIENTKSGAVHLATWYGDSGSAVFFGDTSTWETITAPNQVAAKRPAPTVTQVVDLSTPEGRVKAARQRRAALLSSSTTR